MRAYGTPWSTSTKLNGGGDKPGILSPQAQDLKNGNILNINIKK
jgi:hypothetical protein